MTNKLLDNKTTLWYNIFTLTKHWEYRRREVWEYPRLNREEWVCQCGHECADEIEKIAYWYWPDTEKNSLRTLVSFHCSVCGQYLQFDVRWTVPQIESVKLISPKTMGVGDGETENSASD